MKQIKHCRVHGALGSRIIGGKKLFAVCRYSTSSGGCGAHGNKKCEHMIKADKREAGDE